MVGLCSAVSLFSLFFRCGGGGVLFLQGGEKRNLIFDLGAFGFWWPPVSFRWYLSCKGSLEIIEIQFPLCKDGETEALRGHDSRTDASPIPGALSEPATTWWSDCSGSCSSWVSFRSSTLLPPTAQPSAETQDREDPPLPPPSPRPLASLTALNSIQPVRGKTEQ